uniref:RUN domain-containing protein n=1 Tax=Macrostomum lignano TaxID=282301 RepID=A0A1I8HNJ6_9PLAT
MADKQALKQSLRHASQAIAITRHNLVTVCSLCVKSILDRACFQVVEESSLDLQNLLNIIETIFFFQFKGSIDNKRNPYTVLRSCTSKGTLNLFQTIESLDKLNHFIGRFRGAIRLALMNKCLYQLLDTLLAKRSVLELHYFEDSVFRCPDAVALVSQLAGLDALDLSFDLRCPKLLEELCYPRTCPINYAAHMHLLVLDEAKLDDQIELATDASSPEAEALTEAGASAESETPLSDCAHCDWRARYLRIEAQLKRTAEQKSYLEELNKRLIEEREAATTARQTANTEHANEIKQYENIVLELQVQLTLLQEQYNRQLTASANSGAAATVHAGDGVTRPRLPQLHRQDSEPLQRVSVNDDAYEIEAQEFDEDTVAYRAPSPDCQSESASEAFGYTGKYKKLFRWITVEKVKRLLLFQ